ncbi:MAG: hypothetical protein IKG87_09255 [Clostridia bacterium]|nr:hypothetical protein [Clostridia bacterium]
MNKASFSARLKEVGPVLLKALNHVFFHNGWVKLLALLISLFLWAGLISQDESLTRDRTWQNVNVSITGSDSLKRNGYIVVSDLDEMLSNVSVTAAVPQKQYEAADTSAYNLRVDLSRIGGTGKQELKILSTSSSTYGKVVNTTPSVLNVDVEEYMVRQRVPVSVSVAGDYQNGWYGEWYMSNPSVDPSLIAVNGPRSLVSTISRAKVVLDPETVDWKESTLTTTGEIRLYNRAGEEIRSSLLGITSESLTIDTVLIEASIVPTKSFNTRDVVDLQGETKAGYKVTDIRISPEVVRIAARSEVLEQMDTLVLDRIINLQDLEETTVFQIKVQKPSEDSVLSNDTITVTVEVEKTEQ